VDAGFKMRLAATATAHAPWLPTKRRTRTLPIRHQAQARSGRMVDRRSVWPFGAQEISDLWAAFFAFLASRFSLSDLPTFLGACF
jgi:hypothetical protein